MRPFGLGVDIVEIERFRIAVERQGEPFLKRIFLPSEIAYCAPLKNSTPCYAARFAVKEAVSKAIGTGIGPELGWHDIEVLRKPSGEPYVVIHGLGAETMSQRGILEMMISISHSEHYAVANAIALGKA